MDNIADNKGEAQPFNKMLASLQDHQSGQATNDGVNHNMTEIAALHPEFQRLRESEEKYRALFETMAPGVVFWDAEGNIVDANPSAEEILGYSLEQLQQMQLASDDRVSQHTIHEDQTPFGSDEHPAKVALRTAQPVRNVVLGAFNPKENQFRWIRVNAIPQFRQGEDKPCGVFSTFHDVTDRKQVENSLRFLFNATSMLNSTLDYETTLKNIAQLAIPELADWSAVDMLMPDGSVRRLAVQHIDPGKVALAHEIWERWPVDMSAQTGLPQALRTGKPEFIPEVTDEIIEAIEDSELREIMRGLGLRSSMVVPIVSKGQALGAITFVLAESGRRYGPNDVSLAQELANHAGLAIENAGLYKQSRDLNTELDMRVAERTAELEATVKELESFSYSVSHDLRAPLRTIDGFSRAILEDYADKLDSEGNNYLNRIRAATQQMGQLIDDLLKLSRVTRGEMHREHVDLSLLAHSAITALQSTDATRHVTFEVAPQMLVNADARLMRIVLDNLLDNAWKFTTKSIDPIIEVGSFQQNDETVYFVRDNGAGFDMLYANKLFGPFQRLHSENEFKGSGIGLATVQRIIHRHGGRIWAEGEVGKGATFYFIL